MGLLLTSILPEKFLYLIAPISLIIAGHIVQKRFIGRIVVFSNSVAINVFTISVMEATAVPTLLIWYANVGLILGIIGLFAYKLEQSMPPLYYTVTMAYNSVIIGIIMLLFVI